MLTMDPKLSPLIAATQKYSQAQGISNPSWLDHFKKENLEQLLAAGIPTTKNEDWKYTNLSQLADLDPKPLTPGNFKFALQVKRLTHKNDITIVFVNNVLDENLSSLGNLPKGLTLLSLKRGFLERGKIIQDLLAKYSGTATNPFVLLNRALTENGVFLQIAEKTHVEPVIHIVHVTQAQQKALTTPASYIFCGASSEATIVETHIGFGEEVYLSAPLAEIFLEQNAILHYCKAQSETLKSYHIGNTRVWQERDSHFDGFSFMNGGALTRNDLDIVSNGEGTSSTMNGFYGVNGTQHVDNHSSMDHRQPNCTSNQLYKGILNGASNSVFNGKIFVKPIAQKTNSYQLNKNLVLGKDSKVNTKPQLEIFADDVKCTHGATIGQLNEDEVFYLQSRCISKKTAVKLLAHGFVEDIISKIHNPSIQDKLNILLEPTFESLE